jgi:hypothetical protein
MGKITSFRGKAEIVVTDPSQIMQERQLRPGFG